MRKAIIASVLSALLLAGCSANPAVYSTDKDSSASTGEKKMTGTKSGVDPIDQKLEEALEAIESATAEAISRIQQAATSMPSGKTTSETASAPMTVQEPMTIPLNIETRRGDGTLTFIKVETKPETNEAVFYYETSDEIAKMTNIRETFLIGKSQKKYKPNSFGGVGNKGDIIFQNITDFSDLSTVTLTYAFDGYDPVTVTFDIPGL